jgi:hypothetical protein
MKLHLLFLWSTLFLILPAGAQNSLSVLFLGNSYTSVNNLPQLVSSMATSAGKTLITDSNLPGGQTLSGHLLTAASMAKIRQGNWDYVILQEQSQLPTIEYYRYNDMYPAMFALKDSISTWNPCAKIMTYMTWGRRFGGQQCDPPGDFCSPVFTNFNHMQDTLTSAYLDISNGLNIQCAPVGVAWKNVLNDTNLVLHSSDNSHPVLSGSYLAACVIHSCLWKKPVSGLAYNAGLSASLAAYLQKMSDQTVFPVPELWNLNINKPEAAFTSEISGLSVYFSNQSQSFTNSNLTWFWDFGDGNTSTETEPEHTYGSAGNYTVKLRAIDCLFSDTMQQNIILSVTGTAPTQQPVCRIYPQPASDFIHLEFSRTIPVSCSLRSITGQFLQEVKPNGISATIPSAGLPAGLYFLHLQTADKSDILKIHITH